MSDKFVKYLPLFSIIIFMLSYSYLSAYYNAFGINISVYLNYSEILYAFMPLVILAFGSGFSLMLQSQQDFNRKSTLIPNETPNSNLKKNSFVNWLPYILFLVFFILDIVLKRIFNYYYDEPLITIVPFLVLGFLAAFNYKKSKGVDALYDWRFLLVSVLFFGFVCNNYASNKAEVIKHLGFERSINFTYDTHQIASTKHFFAIGETQTYIFFYNKIDSSTSIFLRSKIDSLVIK